MNILPLVRNRTASLSVLVGFRDSMGDGTLVDPSFYPRVGHGTGCNRGRTVRDRTNPTGSGEIPRLTGDPSSWNGPIYGTPHHPSVRRHSDPGSVLGVETTIEITDEPLSTNRRDWKTRKEESQYHHDCRLWTEYFSHSKFTLFHTTHFVRHRPYLDRSHLRSREGSGGGGSEE